MSGPSANSRSEPQRPALTFRLTLRHLMLLVLASAIPLAIVATALRDSSQLWVVRLGSGLTVLPMLYAAIAMLLARRGPLRDWIITALLAAQTGLCFVLLTVFLAIIGFTGMPLGLGPVMAIVVVMAGFAGCFVYLLRRLVPRRCPGCARTRLLRYGRATVPRVPNRSFPAWCCVSCGQVFGDVRPNDRSPPDTG